MNAVMDNRLSDVDKEEEVKKLQELVKKLEIQNEELKSERQAFLKNEKLKLDEKGAVVDPPLDILTCDNDKEIKEKEVEHLPLQNMEHLSDDETWLLDTPKSKPHSDKWLRKDVDDPSLISVKKNLVNKLDEIANSPRHSPRHSLYSPTSSSGVLSPESPPSSRGEIDTRTFIRPKKRRSLALENKEIINNEKSNWSNSGNVAHIGWNIERLGHSNGSFGSEEEDRLSSASDGSYSSYRLADVEDVNTLARLQEESLKLPEMNPVGRLQGIRNSTNIIPKRISPSSGQSNKVYLPNGGSEGSGTSSQEDLCAPLVSQSSPRRVIPRSSLQPPKRYFSTGVNQMVSREGSDMSTPPDSPYNSQNNLEATNSRPTSSRLPSLTRRLGKNDVRVIESISPSGSRGASPLPLQDPNKQTDKRPAARTSRLQTPQARGTSRLSAPSPVRIPLGVPQLTELPRPKPSEVPRSSSATKATSRLQPPRLRASQSPASQSAQNDWREGCY